MEAIFNNQNGIKKRYEDNTFNHKLTHFRHFLDSTKKINEKGIYFRFAKDLQSALGYKERDEFIIIIEKAKNTILNSDIQNHFIPICNNIDVVDNYILSRLACLHIAQNGDSKIEEIAFAKNYFAIQTTKMEKIEESMDDSNELDRIAKRTHCTLSYKYLAKHTIEDKNFSPQDFMHLISDGDKVFHGSSTQEIKKKMDIKDTPLDYWPSEILQIKALIYNFTRMNTKEMFQKHDIVEEHKRISSILRRTAQDIGINPSKIQKCIPIKEVKKNLKKKGYDVVQYEKDAQNQYEKELSLENMN